jgi:hypothetical protein
MKRHWFFSSSIREEWKLRSRFAVTNKINLARPERPSFLAVQ